MIPPPLLMSKRHDPPLADHFAESMVLGLGLGGAIKEVVG